MTPRASLFVVSSPYKILSLEEAVTRMAIHPDVRAVMLLGSTATPNEHRQYSDNDVLIVLKSKPPIHVAVTVIEHRLTDLIFADIHAIHDLLKLDLSKIPLDSWDARLVGWIRSGKIAFDTREGNLRNIKDQLMEKDPTFVGNDNRVYTTWFSINYNLRQNQRLWASDDPLNHMAVQLRLTYCLSDIMKGYFIVREMPWTGEKAAIRYWQEADPAFFAAVQRFLQAHNTDAQLDAYEALAELTLEPAGRLWMSDVTAIQPPLDRPIDDEIINNGLTLVENLLRG